MIAFVFLVILASTFAILMPRVFSSGSDITSLAPAFSTKTLYSVKKGARTITSSCSSSTRARRQMQSDAAAPQVMYMRFSDISMPKRELMLSAIALLTPASPCAEVYPCREIELFSLRSAAIVSFTSAGAGTLGFPRLKSNTFSAPISAARVLLYSNISLMIERRLPRPYIFLLYPTLNFSFNWAYAVFLLFSVNENLLDSVKIAVAVEVVGLKI